MRVLNVRPAQQPASCLARFDLDLSPDIRLCGMTLRRNRGGILAVHAPSYKGRKVAHLAPHVAAKAVELVAAALREVGR